MSGNSIRPTREIRALERKQGRCVFGIVREVGLFLVKRPVRNLDFGSIHRVFAVSVSFALLLSLLAGCARHSNSEHYYLVATNVNLPYWHTAFDGFKKAGDQYGVTTDLRGPGGFDPQAEVEEFRHAVALKPAGMLVSVADAKLMAPEIDSALAAGIPVITIDSDAPESQRLYFIGTNNLVAGRLGGQRLATLMNGTGNIVFFTMPNQPNLVERLKGYKDALAAYPEIKVAEVFDMKGDSGTAMDHTQELLARTGAGRIDGFVCLEASAGKDVAEAFNRNNQNTRILVTMDVDEATLQLVKKGTINATISQKPFTMAYVGLKALDDLHHYPLKPLVSDYSTDALARVPGFVDTGVSLVDKGNVEKFMSGLDAGKH